MTPFVQEMPLDVMKLFSWNVILAEDVFVSDEIMFDIATIDTADDRTKCVHISKPKRFAGPEFLVTPFLQQMQKYGF